MAKIFEPNFIDKPDYYGPFSGALIVMNIGQDNYQQLAMPASYEEALREAIADAHAKGHMVLYLWDATKGVSLPPLGYETTEGVDFYRLGAELGKARLDFPWDPAQRRQAFESMADTLFSHRDFFFEGSSTAFMGHCSIDGQEVLMPLTKL